MEDYNNSHEETCSEDDNFRSFTQACFQGLVLKYVKSANIEEQLNVDRLSGRLEQATTIAEQYGGSPEVRCR